MALENIGFKILKITQRSFRWYMSEEEVMKYFGFKELPFKIPKKFWVFDKPKSYNNYWKKDSHLNVTYHN